MTPPPVLWEIIRRPRCPGSADGRFQYESQLYQSLVGNRSMSEDRAALANISETTSGTTAALDGKASRVNNLRNLPVETEASEAQRKRTSAKQAKSNAEQGENGQQNGPRKTTQGQGLRLLIVADSTATRDLENHTGIRSSLADRC
jgi:hypothetical protein